MRTTSLALVTLLASCAPEYQQPRDACLATAPGGASASEDANAAVVQLNCYRRFAGLGKARVDTELSSAAAAHASYLDVNWTNGDSLTEELPGYPLFTGATLADRATSHEFYYASDATVAVLEVVETKLEATMPPGAMISAWMDDPFARQYMLQPSVMGVGFGQTNTWAVYDVAYSEPTLEASDHPITYPAAKQIGVATTWVAPQDVFVVSSEIPPIVQGVSYGYPITLTVGGYDMSTSSANPYDVQLLEAPTLTCSVDGDVPVVVFTPENLATSTLLQTVVIIPAMPLAPSSDCHLTTRLGWSGTTGDVDITYTTGE